MNLPRSIGMTSLGAGKGPVRPRRRSFVSRSDRSLIRAAQRGSSRALELLIDRHWPEATRVALGIVRDAHAAEDIAQESLLAVARNLAAFDNERPFRPWLHRIVVNSALDWLRTEKRQAERVPDPEVAGQRADSSPPSDVDAELIAALEELDPRDRAILMLRHVLGYRSQEVGEILEMPAATVRTRAARSLNRLRKSLSTKGEEDE